MPFFELQELQELPLIEGIITKSVYARQCSVSMVELAPFARIPSHHHANEQIGIVLEGEVEYTIGDEIRVCSSGTIFIVPPNTVHSGTVVSKQPTKLIDVFSPPREVTEAETFYTSP